MATQKLFLLPTASQIDPFYVLPASNNGKTYKVSLELLSGWLYSKDVVSKNSDYTISYSDKKSIITFTGPGSSTLLIPNNTDQAIPVGTVIDVSNYNVTGAVNIIGDNGVTVHSALGSYVRSFGLASLIKIDSNTWILSGNLSPYQDTFFNKTKLLLRMTDSNFYDSSLSPKSVSSSNVTITNSNTKFGDNSAQFASGAYLSLPSSSDFNFGTNDFTIECWVRLNSQGGNGYNHYFSINNQDTFAFKSYSGYYYLFANSNTIVSTTITPILNTWHHLALVRYGQRMYIFVNGELKGEAIVSPSATFGTTGAARIGTASGLNGEYLDGLMNDFRVTVGQARYTMDFTPPSEHLYKNGNSALPNDILGLQLWLDASDSSTLLDATSGGSPASYDSNVLGWQDKSSNNYVAIQSDSAKAPIRKSSVINNKDALYFTGSQYLDLSSINMSQRITAFIVWNPANNVYAFDSTSSNNRVTLLNADGLYAYAGYDMKNIQNTLTNNWTVCSIVYDKTSSSAYINSVLAVTGNPGSNNMTSLRIGSRYSLEAYLNGYIGEILLYDASMTENDRILIENYLKNKWSIVQ